MKKRVLVFPCGSEIGLEIYRSLRFSKDFEVYGASSLNDHGEYVYENYIDEVPFVDSEDFIPRINEIIKKYKIDFIFPAHDSVVLKMAQNADRLQAKVITSTVLTCEITRSKKLTYETLRGIVEVPDMYDLDTIPKFPVFLKPDVGQGSKGVLRAESLEDVRAALKRDDSLIILEFLPGKEYTIDCFTDKSGKLIFSQGRERIRISNGISVRSRPVDDSRFTEMAEKINEVLDFTGVWFFQVKMDANYRPVLIEAAPRVAGTMALCRMQGINLPLLSLYIQLGLEVSILNNNVDIEIDRALAAKFKLNTDFDTVYVDLDDTIVLEDKLNYTLIGLLYKFISAGKQLVLITKHIEEVESTLGRHKITTRIFDKIVVLSKDQNKHEFMSRGGIFIDDSFAERKTVHDKLGIPVFDVSEAVELL